MEHRQSEVVLKGMGVQKDRRLWPRADRGEGHSEGHPRC